MQLSIRNQFLVLYKDTSVHNIVQFNSSFCSVNTVSFMMVFCIFTCLPLGNSCGKLFYILIFIYTLILEYFDALFSICFLILISIFTRLYLDLETSYSYGFILIVPIKGYFLLLLYYRVDLYLYMYFLV